MSEWMNPKDGLPNCGGKYFKLVQFKYPGDSHIWRGFYCMDGIFYTNRNRSQNQSLDEDRVLSSRVIAWRYVKE